MTALFKDPRSKINSGYSYGCIAEPSEGIQVVMGALASRDPILRARACAALPQVCYGFRGLSARAAVPNLLSLINDVTVRQSVVTSLSYLGPDGAAAIPTFLAAVVGSDRDYSMQVMRALADMWPTARPAIPALKHLLFSADRVMRVEAATTLAHFGQAGKAAVPVLVEELVSRNRTRVWHAAETLALLGPEASEAAPALRAVVAATSVSNGRQLLEGFLHSIDK